MIALNSGEQLLTDKTFDIISIDKDTITLTTYTHSYGTNAFCQAIFDGSYVWLVPYSANKFVRIDPGTGARTDFNFSFGAAAFINAIYKNGYVWCCPLVYDNLVKLNVSTGTIIEYNLSAYADNAFYDIVADNNNQFWFAPHLSSVVLRFSEQTKAVVSNSVKGT